MLSYSLPPVLSYLGLTRSSPSSCLQASSGIQPIFEFSSSVYLVFVWPLTVYFYSVSCRWILTIFPFEPHSVPGYKCINIAFSQSNSVLSLKVFKEQTGPVIPGERIYKRGQVGRRWMAHPVLLVHVLPWATQSPLHETKAWAAIGGRLHTSGCLNVRESQTESYPQAWNPLVITDSQRFTKRYFKPIMSLLTFKLLSQNYRSLHLKE